MGKPVISGNPESFFLSAAQVLVDGVDQGFVSKVKIKVKHLTTEAKTDQMGKAIANMFYVSDDVTVEMVFDEITATRMKQAFPFGDLITGMGGSARLTWGQDIGGDFYSKAKELVIKPTVDDTDFLNRNFTFYKAIPVGDSEMSMTPEGKMEVKTVFHCFPDPTQPNGEFFGFFGDINAGAIVHATHGSVTPGGGNVGSGSLGTIIVNDDFTKTETWTATCIATSGGGIFAVSGTVTGAKGNAVAGSSYNSNSITPANSEVGFLISSGVTAFAVGDTFSFPTTQKQYT